MYSIDKDLQSSVILRRKLLTAFLFEFGRTYYNYDCNEFDNPFFSILADINECFPRDLSLEHELLAHNCHSDANCSNTKGSFYCTCKTGYAGDGTVCVGMYSFIFKEKNPRSIYYVVGLSFLVS